MSSVVALFRQAIGAHRPARTATLAGGAMFLTVAAITWQGMTALGQAAEFPLQTATLTPQSSTPAFGAPALDTPIQKEAIKIVYVPRPESAITPNPIVRALPLANPTAATPEQPVQVAIGLNHTTLLQAPTDCITDLRAFAARQTIFFNIGSAKVDTGKFTELRKLGDMVLACEGAMIQVAGHSDASGTDAMNLLLSWQRADNTIAALDAFGVSTRAFQPVGFGARIPASQGDDGSDELSRRVEFQVIETNGRQN